LSPVDVPEGKSTYPITDLAADNQGLLWIVRSSVDGMTSFDESTGGFDEIRTPDVFGAPKTAIVDGSGSIWLTVALSGEDRPTRTGGRLGVEGDKLAVFDPTARSFRVLPVRSTSVVPDASRKKLYLDTMRVASAENGSALTKPPTKGAPLAVDRNGAIWLQDGPEIKVLDAGGYSVTRVFDLPSKEQRYPHGGTPEAIRPAFSFPLVKDAVFGSSGDAWVLLDNSQGGQIARLSP